MTPKERLTRQARGQEVDVLPTIGGWIGGARNLAALADLSLEKYLADPAGGVVLAHRTLGVDGMVTPIIPRAADQVRTGAVLEENFNDIEPEALLEHANTLPDTEKGVLADFDPVQEEKGFRDYFNHALANWQGIVPIPNYWDLGGHFPLYVQFGYVAFLSACSLYPEAVDKIWWAKSLHSRERAKILARLYRELDLVPLLFCGEDLCNNQGPMVAPDFLRKHYFPHVKMILEPIVNAGVRVIHHCDGDVRPLVDDYLSLGFSGLQGFQYELEVDPWEFKNKRGPLGEETIFFTGLSVTYTLPFGTPQDVKDEVDYFFDLTDGGRGMFLFTSNVTGVEVPSENLRTAYQYAKSHKMYAPANHRPWPWSKKLGGMNER